MQAVAHLNCAQAGVCPPTGPSAAPVKGFQPRGLSDHQQRSSRTAQLASATSAAPSHADRAASEGNIAVFNNNPAGSLSWHRQLTSPEEGAQSPPSEDQEWQPSQGWRSLPHHLPADELWAKIRNEARRDAEQEPALASFLHSSILAHSSFARSLSVLLANKLANSTLPGTQLMRLIAEAHEDDPDIMEAGIADLQAVYDRDPACERFTQCLLYFKGYQALQCYRICHWLWKKNRKSLAMVLQSRITEAMQVDIHPAARLGRGILIDHATGVVIGETAIVGDNVSMLHHVTLGAAAQAEGCDIHTLIMASYWELVFACWAPSLWALVAKWVQGQWWSQTCHATVLLWEFQHASSDRIAPKEPSLDMDHVADFVFDYVI